MSFGGSFFQWGMTKWTILPWLKLRDNQMMFTNLTLQGYVINNESSSGHTNPKQHFACRCWTLGLGILFKCKHKYVTNYNTMHCYIDMILSIKCKSELLEYQDIWCIFHITIHGLANGGLVKELCLPHILSLLNRVQLVVFLILMIIIFHHVIFTCLNRSSTIFTKSRDVLGCCCGCQPCEYGECKQCISFLKFFFSMRERL